jgi:hypothetical protein
MTEAMPWTEDERARDAEWIAAVIADVEHAVVPYQRAYAIMGVETDGARVFGALAGDTAGLDSVESSSRRGWRVYVDRAAEGRGRQLRLHSLRALSPLELYEAATVDFGLNGAGALLAITDLARHPFVRHDDHRKGSVMVWADDLAEMLWPATDRTGTAAARRRSVRECLEELSCMEIEWGTDRVPRRDRLLDVDLTPWSDDKGLREMPLVVRPAPMLLPQEFDPEAKGERVGTARTYGHLPLSWSNLTKAQASATQILAGRLVWRLLPGWSDHATALRRGAAESDHPDGDTHLRATLTIADAEALKATPGEVTKALDMLRASRVIHGYEPVPGGFSVLSMPALARAALSSSSGITPRPIPATRGELRAWADAMGSELIVERRGDGRTKKHRVSTAARRLGTSGKNLGRWCSGGDDEPLERSARRAVFAMLRSGT